MLTQHRRKAPCNPTSCFSSATNTATVFSLHGPKSVVVNPATPQHSMVSLHKVRILKRHTVSSPSAYPAVLQCFLGDPPQSAPSSHQTYPPSHRILAITVMPPPPSEKCTLSDRDKWQASNIDPTAISPHHHLRIKKTPFTCLVQETTSLCPPCCETLASATSPNL